MDKTVHRDPTRDNPEAPLQSGDGTVATVGQSTAATASPQVEGGHGHDDGVESGPNQVTATLSVPLSEPGPEWPLGDLPEQRPKWDLIQAARLFDPEVALSGKRSQIAIYRLPKFVLWGVEALAKSMLRGGKDAAATCALEVGLSRLRRFPGLAEICLARGKVVRLGDPETMNWFDTFGSIDVDTGGSGVLEAAYKRHVPERLAKQLGQLSADLGMPNSLLAMLTLMAAQLGATPFVKQRYQECIITTLRRFCEHLEYRAERAQLYAKATLDEPEHDVREYSVEDVLPRSRNAKVHEGR